MKKISIIVFLFGSAMFYSNQGQAQHFYTSFGVGVSWNIPAYVNYSIQDNYFGYDVAHVRRFNRHGFTNYNVLLHRNGWYVEVRLNNHGHIYKTINHRWDYPLMSHRCGGHCGYHANYYRTYYPNYHHHKKIVYVDSHHAHGKHHNKKHHDYYTKVHVQKKHNYNHHEKRNNARVEQRPTRSRTEARRSTPERRTTYNRSSKRDDTHAKVSSSSSRRVSESRSSRSPSKNTVAYNGAKSRRSR